ncbi:MAG: flagellin [Candidatus Tectomicrobia bacterium]|nr:flagellin [Candidatus Tectomicrobia bacterium]
MGLRINQNIAALNAARNLRITDSSMSRSLERLSSGFRINRAADDPAGLIISENLRAQVAGLGQAIRNASTAVNLIKTAEASLDEALKQLRSIRTLALDALNTGAADSVALAADQTAIASSIASLTRIGQNTQFGKIKLLDGSAGVTGSTSDSNVLSFISATEKTQTGTFKVESITAATKGEISRTLNNEFETAAAASNAVIDFDANETLAFVVDFGTQAGLSASDVAALGADLKAAGLVDNDTTQAGITIRFDETNAIAYVVASQSGGGFTTDEIDGAVSLRAALNKSAIGKVLTFNDDGDTGGTSKEFRVTGKMAGLGFSLLDATVASTNGTGGDAGITATQTLADGTDNAYDLDAANDAVEIVVDFGIGWTFGDKAVLGKAIASAGVVVESSATTKNNANAQVIHGRAPEQELRGQVR